MDSANDHAINGFGLQMLRLRDFTT